MFINAQDGVKDWTKASRLNKGLSIGTAFNILSKITSTENLLVTTNQIFEFGKFLPNYKATIKPKLPERIPVHQEPNTFKFDWEHSTEPDGLPF